MKGRTVVLGRVHELTLNSLHNLFGLYVEKNDLLNAEKVLFEVINRKRIEFGDNHSSTIDSLINLGYFYRLNKHLKEAERIYLIALDQAKYFSNAHETKKRAFEQITLLYQTQNREGEVDELKKKFFED